MKKLIVVVFLFVLAVLLVAEVEAGDVQWDVDAGARKNWGTSGASDGSESDSYYLKGEIYPIKAGNGVKIGAAAKFSDWGGETKSGSTYQGERWQVGPAVNITGESWDADGAVYYGHQEKSSLSHKGVGDESSADLIGAGVGAAFYSREDAGNKWFSRTEVSGEILVPTNQKNDETSSIVNVGVREYIYDPENIPIRSFADVRLSLEHPVDPKLGAYVGVQDKWGVVSINAGPRFNLENGSTFVTVGGNVDVGKAVKMGIRAHRKGQISRERETSSALGME